MDGTRVAGLWELGWNTPIKEIELWEHPLRDFGVERMYMSPVSGIASGAVQERHELSTAIAECRMDGLTVVFIDERGDVPLHAFAHPDRALYVFGRSSQSALPLRQPGDWAVRIATPAAAGLLWPHQAAAIVLYDRQVKSWQ